LFYKKTTTTGSDTKLIETLVLQFLDKMSIKNNNLKKSKSTVKISFKEFFWCAR